MAPDRIAWEKPVRVVVVDDNDDVRLMLRLQFQRDARFEVVGEGSDGREAIDVAAAEQPDLIILDRQMPRLSGMHAMSEIRRVSPGTAIILYTANADPGAYQAALDAGALHVLAKMGTGTDFVDRLIGTLAASADFEPTIEVRVGPVSAAAARVWVANTTKIIEAIAARPEVLLSPVPSDVLDMFRSFLRQWGTLADETDEFRWVARASRDDVERILEHWATIDLMTDAQLDELGIAWSPPEGQPFFQALTTGVLDALRRHDDLQRLASRLDEQWAPYRTSA